MSEKKTLTLNEFLNSHETFQLALIEGVHRYFYDNYFDVYTGKMFDADEAKYYFDLLQSMYCQRPGWRYELKKKLERYHGWEPTTAIYIEGKPKRDFQININIEPHDTNR